MLKDTANRSTRNRLGVLVLTNYRHGGGKGSKLFTWKQITELAYMKRAPHKILARSFHCSARTVGRMQVAVCSAYMTMQACLMSWILAFVAAHPPSLVVSSQLWDETGERLVLDAMAPTGQQSSTWQVLVLRKAFSMTWLNDAGEVFSRTFEVVCPPMPLPSCSARHLYSAIHFHKQMKEIEDFERKLMGSSETAVAFLECDGATGNDKYMAYLSQLRKGDNSLQDN